MKPFRRGATVTDLDIVLAVGKDFDVDEAVSIYTSKIWVNDWVSMKYKYNNDGCSHIVPTEQTNKLLREYKRAVLVIGKNMKEFKIAVLAMEKELVKNGYFKSLALINGPCDFCSSVDIDPEIKRRPSLELMGIDIHTTVRKFKKNTEPPKEGEIRPYAIILVE
jgi:predicted metal-binding protein